MKCALCAKRLYKGKLRYITRIETFAAYDTLEITIDDLLQDQEKIIKKLLTSLRKNSTKSLEEDISKSFSYTLCPKCRKIYIKDPLGKKAKIKSYKYVQ